MPRRKPPHSPAGTVDRRWHLARTPLEVDVAELEYALMRSFEAFGRWQTECLANVSELVASGPENALLHIIRMNERPKSIHDLAYMTNREDVPNIQYSLRKLINGGFVVRQAKGGRVSPTRGALLIDAVKSVPELAHRLEDATRTLELMTGLYTQAARAAATHRHHPASHSGPGGS